MLHNLPSLFTKKKHIVTFFHTDNWQTKVVEPAKLHQSSKLQICFFFVKAMNSLKLSLTFKSFISSLLFKSLRNLNLLFKLLFWTLLSEMVQSYFTLPTHIRILEYLVILAIMLLQRASMVIIVTKWLYCLTLLRVKSNLT